MTLLSNGSIKGQHFRVQRFLEQDSKVIGESQILRGKKTVLMEQEYGETLDKTRIVALQFNSVGEGIEIGIFDEFKEQIKTTIKTYVKILEKKYKA